MPPYALFGLLICAALKTVNGHSVGRPAETMSTCEAAGGVLRTQRACSVENENLLDAEYKRERDKVCKYYVEMLSCVAKNVKECFDFILEQNMYYAHSPFSCVPPPQEMLKWQKMVHGNEPSEPKGSTETTPDSAPQPWTNGQGGGASQGEGGAKQPKGGDSEKGYDIKTDSDRDKTTNKDDLGSQGTQEEHKGTDSDKDAGRHLASWSLAVVLVLAVTSRQLPGRLLS